MEKIELAQRLVGNERAEPQQTLTEGQALVYTGTAMGDSVDGYVEIAPLGDLVSEDGSATVTVPTTVPVSTGESVYVTLYGDTVGKQPYVSGVVGEGDSTRATIAWNAYVQQQDADRLQGSIDTVGIMAKGAETAVEKASETLTKLDHDVRGAMTFDEASATLGIGYPSSGGAPARSLEISPDNGVVMKEDGTVSAVFSTTAGIPTLYTDTLYVGDDWLFVPKSNGHLVLKAV